MHGKLKGRQIQRQRSLRRWVVTLVVAGFTFGLLIVAQEKDIPKKWAVAVAGTLGPFSLLVYAFRRWLLRWSFWLALACCLSVHIILIWIIFEYVLAGIENLSIWLWLPVMLVETLILLVAVKRIEESLTGRHENIKLTL